MRKSRKILGVARLRFSQDFPRVRVLLVFALMLLYVAAVLKPMRAYGEWAGCGVSPSAFVFMVNEYLCQLVFAGGTFLGRAGQGRFQPCRPVHPDGPALV